VFDGNSAALDATAAVRELGFTDQYLGFLGASRDGGLLGTLADASDTTAVANALQAVGVPAGEARFYAHEAHDGHSLLVVNAEGRAEEVRQLLRERGGYDVQSRGAEFIRGDSQQQTNGAAPLPVDLTTNWEDFRSRYQMLWQQHYGTTDATWDEMEPVYQRAWQVANQPEYRGRPWSEVESAVQREWQQAQPGSDWSSVAGPIQDVWEDVAQEAATGAEGGADRRIASQGNDQTVAARDVAQQGQGAA